MRKMMSCSKSILELVKGQLRTQSNKKGIKNGTGAEFRKVSLCFRYSDIKGGEEPMQTCTLSYDCGHRIGDRTGYKDDVRNWWEVLK
jgi:hypothetical protein